MPVQIDGKTWGEVRPARADGTLVKMAEARVWDGEAWKIVWQGKDVYERLNPVHYFRLNGDTANVGSSSAALAVNSSRATIGAEFMTFKNYTGSRYVEIGGLPDASVGDSVTLAFWVNLNSDRNYPTFLARGPGRNDGYEAYLSSGQLRVGDGNNDNYESFPGDSLVGSWNHLAFRITNTSTSTTHAKVWQNGVSLGEQSIGARMRPTSSHPLRLGSGYGGDYPFVGGMDTIAYFDRGLTDAEVLSIYNAGRL